MSVAAHKPLNDASATAPSFSYAQAAKGRSPSAPSMPLATKAISETANDKNLRRSSVSDSKDVMSELSKDSGDDNACIVHGEKTSKSIAKPDSCSVVLPEAEVKGSEATQQSQISAQPQANASSPSSPSYGTTSTFTLSKEDEQSSTANGSSDSTWDKQSQSSQTGVKNGVKTGENKDEIHLINSNEETPLPAPLKEAPLPAVNFWQHRKEIQEAKAKSKVSPGVQMSKGSSTDVSTSNSINASDPSVEPRKLDGKRKVKVNSSGVEAKLHNSSVKEGSKPADVRARNGEEEKGINRNVKTADVEKPSTTGSTPLPPPGDVVSWPILDNAQGEEKKKAQQRTERSEKEKTPAVKPHGKEKWMPVPYVPTAIFNTPMPPNRRGGRLARGGRENGSRGASTSHGSTGTEKPATGPSGNSANPPSNNTNERGRTDVHHSKGNSSSKPKRAMSAGPSAVREQRKAADANQFEKPREAGTAPSRASQSNGFNTHEYRRASASTQTDDQKTRRPVITSNNQTSEYSSNTVKASQIITDKPEKSQQISQDTHSHPRSALSDQRHDGSFKPQENAREHYSQGSNRERGEGRIDRGRGGFRGRGVGNHNFSNSNQTGGPSYAASHSNQHQNPTFYSNHKSQTGHERHSSQLQGASQSQSQTSTRNFRSGSRSQAVPYSAAYNRLSSGSNGSHPGPPHLSNLQTDLANSYGYQPGSQGIMSAMPYNAYMEQMSLFGMVSMQMEYYFSVDNLCKDMFLRKHMDSQGFVFLSVIAKFNRIKQLTQEMDLIRYVCMNSPNIEFQTGVDGVDRLRKRDGWQQWILSKEERDPSAQTDGPTEVQQPFVLGSHLYDVPPILDEQQTMSPQSNYKMDGGSYSSGGGPPPPYFPNMTINNPAKKSTNESSQTTLSAAVPEFAPAVSQFSSRGLQQSEVNPSGTKFFTDEQVESLMIVVRKPINPVGSPSPSNFPSSSRTFSNGSIDGRTINDEISKYEERQSRPVINGDSTHEVDTSANSATNQRPRSPFAFGSPIQKVPSNASPVFWVKDKETPIDSLPNDLTHESYNMFRRNALKQREQSGAGNCHRDMDILYQFWSHFLIRNFNTRMYDEFRQIAFEDAAKNQSHVGIKNLIQYYEESILSQKVVSDIIARDFVDLVKNERPNTERPAFDKLRAAWRNGAFNMKNRKKIDSIINTELKAELER